MLKWWSRGNLNLTFILLIYKVNIFFIFLLEYQLEYLENLYSTWPPTYI